MSIVNEIGFNCERAGNLYGKNILYDIWTAMNEAEIIVADVTPKTSMYIMKLALHIL